MAGCFCCSAANYQPWTPRFPQKSWFGDRTNSQPLAVLPLFPAVLLQATRILDTGHIVAFENSVQYRLEKATGKTEGLGGFLKGMVKSALSGEGFVCR